MTDILTKLRAGEIHNIDIDAVVELLKKHSKIDVYVVKDTTVAFHYQTNMVGDTVILKQYLGPLMHVPKVPHALFVTTNKDLAFLYAKCNIDAYTSSFPAWRIAEMRRYLDETEKHIIKMQADIYGLDVRPTDTDNV